MSKFFNPEPVTIDFIVPEGTKPTDINPLTGVEEVKEVLDVVETPVNLETLSETPSVQEEQEIVPIKTEQIDESYEDNPYLKIINKFFDKGIFDTENVYEGFDQDTEPSEEVLERFIEHNYELRDKKVIEDFIGGISPLTQRILEYDLNSGGQGTSQYLRTLLEENNIKSLNVENEYDQEKIVRLWYQNEDWSAEEIEEKVEDLKTASLLAKEASKVKPKLDAKAEAIAKKEEEAQRMLKQIELRRKEEFFDKVESIIKTGTVDNIKIGREDAEKIMSLLFVDDVPVNLPEGKELRMNYLEAEIFRHKYSNKGNPNLLIQIAYLLSNPEKFYKQFADAAKTQEVNEFVKEQKYNITTKSAPVIEKTKKDKKETRNVPWNKSW